MAGDQSEEKMVVIVDIDGTLVHVAHSHMEINDDLVNDLIQQRKQGAHVALLTGRDCEMMQSKLMLSIMHNCDDPSVIQSEISIFRQNLTINIINQMNDRAKDQGCDSLIESRHVLTSRDNVLEGNYYYQRYLKDYEHLLTAYIDYLLLLPDTELLDECGKITGPIPASKFMGWLKNNSPAFAQEHSSLIDRIQQSYEQVHLNLCPAPSATHTKAYIIRDYLQVLKDNINKTFTKLIFHEDQKDILKKFMVSVRDGFFKKLLSHCYVNHVTPPSNENTGWVHQSSQDLSQGIGFRESFCHMLGMVLQSLTKKPDIDDLGRHGFLPVKESPFGAMVAMFPQKLTAQRNEGGVRGHGSSLLKGPGIFRTKSDDHAPCPHDDSPKNGGSMPPMDLLTKL